MLARRLRILRAWWRGSPRAQRLPGALALPAVVAGAGVIGLFIHDPLLSWLYIGLAAAGIGLGIATTYLVLTGRQWP